MGRGLAQTAWAAGITLVPWRCRRYTHWPITAVDFLGLAMLMIYALVDCHSRLSASPIVRVAGRFRLIHGLRACPYRLGCRHHSYSLALPLIYALADFRNRLRDLTTPNDHQQSRPHGPLVERSSWHHFYSMILPLRCALPDNRSGPPLPTTPCINISLHVACTFLVLGIAVDIRIGRFPQ